MNYDEFKNAQAVERTVFAHPTQTVRELIVQHLEDSPHTITELATLIGCAKVTVSVYLSDLVKDSIVIKKTNREEGLLCFSYKGVNMMTIISAKKKKTLIEFMKTINARNSNQIVYDLLYSKLAGDHKGVVEQLKLLEDSYHEFEKYIAGGK